MITITVFPSSFWFRCLSIFFVRWFFYNNKLLASEWKIILTKWKFFLWKITSEVRTYLLRMVIKEKRQKNIYWRRNHSIFCWCNLISVILLLLRMCDFFFKSADAIHLCVAIITTQQTLCKCWSLYLVFFSVRGSCVALTNKLPTLTIFITSTIVWSSVKQEKKKKKDK